MVLIDFRSQQLDWLLMIIVIVFIVKGKNAFWYFELMKCEFYHKEKGLKKTHLTFIVFKHTLFYIRGLLTTTTR